jgi:hypothetical protein
MKIVLEVTPTEGDTYQVSTSLRVHIDWERKYNRSLLKTIQADDISVEHLTALAYHAAKQAGISVPMSLDGFIDKVEGVTVVDVIDTNPTNATSTDAD